MKKSVFIAGMALVALASCSSDVDVVEQPAALRSSVLTASFAQGAAETRTALADDGLALNWTTSDVIKVFSSSSAVEYTLSEGAGTKSGKFSSESVPEGFEPTAAVYPASIATSLSSNKLAVALPTEYAYSEGMKNVPLYGAITDGNIAFQHLAGMLRIKYAKLPEGASKLVVTADKGIAGACEVTDVTASGAALAPATGATTSYTVTGLTGGTTDAELFVPLLAQEYSTITLVVKDASDAEISGTKVTWMNKTIEVGKIYTATLKSGSVSGETSGIIKQYDTIADALSDGATTVTLNEDVTGTVPTITTDVIIDLNEHTFTHKYADGGTGNTGFYVKESGATLTIKNGKIAFEANENVGTNSSNVSYPVPNFAFYNIGKLVLDKVDVTLADNTVWGVYGKGDVTLTNSSIINPNSVKAAGRYGIAAFEDLTIEGCTIYVNRYIGSNSAIMVYGNNKTVSVKNSNIDAAYCFDFYGDENTITIDNVKVGQTDGRQSRSFLEFFGDKNAVTVTGSTVACTQYTEPYNYATIVFQGYTNSSNEHVVAENNTVNLTNTTLKVEYPSGTTTGGGLHYTVGFQNAAKSGNACQNNTVTIDSEANITQTYYEDNGGTDDEKSNAESFFYDMTVTGDTPASTNKVVIGSTDIALDKMYYKYWYNRRNS